MLVENSDALFEWLTEEFSGYMFCVNHHQNDGLLKRVYVERPSSKGDCCDVIGTLFVRWIDVNLCGVSYFNGVGRFNCSLASPSLGSELRGWLNRLYDRCRCG